MKKLKSLLIASIGIVALTASCNDDFLLKEPLGQIAGPSLNNAEGVEGKLIAAYRTLSGQGMNGGGTWYYDIHGWIFGSIASEIAFQVQDKAFDYLDAPVQKINTADTPAPYSPVLLEEWLPSAQDVIDAVNRVMYTKA